jgi:PAS domain S-box-containing protein
MESIMNLLMNSDGSFSIKNASILSILFLIIFTTIIIIFRDDLYFKSVFSDVFMPIINLLAAISLLYAAKLSKVYGRRVYYAWLLLGIGQLFFAFGDISWGYIELYLNQSPIFSISDIFYLAYYPLFALGIFLLPRARFNKLDLTKTVLDISVVGITMGLLLWTFLIIPMFMDVEGNIESTYISLSYVILDFILLFALLDLIYNQISSLKEDPLLLLAAGIIFQIISDIFFIYQTSQGTFASGSLVDIGWLIGFLFIGLAGILQSNIAIQNKKNNLNKSKEEVNRPEWTSYMPFIWIVLAYIAFAWTYHQNHSIDLEPIIWIGTIIVSLVIIRQIISYREISQLYHAAENEISKRIKTEKILKSERDKAQRYLDIAGVIILVLNQDGEVILINKKGCEVLGYEEKEIIGKKWADNFLDEKNSHKTKNVLFGLLSKDVRNNKDIGHYQSSVLSKDGKKRIISWTNKLITNTDGEVTGLISSGEDITEKKLEESKKKKNIENTLKRQNALLNLSKKDFSELKMFLRNLTEVDSKILNVERVSIWFFNEEMSQIKCKDLYSIKKDSHEEGNVLEADDYPNYFKAITELHSMAAHDAQRDPLTNEFTETYLKPLGIVSMMDAPIWLKGKLIGVICHEHVGEELREWTLEEQDFAGAIANMVSLSLEADEHRKAEAKIKESLKEKEVLLKEIHHRVKNNMQIISSLLNLQSRQIKDPEIVDIFKESQSRVKSMSMIHERLYQSKTLSSINFGEYINSLSLDLLRTYASDPDLVKLNINAEKIRVNIDTAIPCGLILTELVSNAFKYAFPDGRKGEIKIDFYKKGDLFTLKVSDNGVGIPESLDHENTTSLGLLLVNSLIKQIDGDLTLETSPGSTFTMKFKEVNYEARI